MLLACTVVGLTITCWLLLSGVANAAGPDVLTNAEMSPKAGDAGAEATGSVNGADDALPEPAADTAKSTQEELAAPDDPAPPAKVEPATDAAATPVTDTAEDVADAAEPVTETVVDTVAPVTEPVEDAAPVIEAVEDAAAPASGAIENVADGASPVTDPVEETVRAAMDAAAPVTEPVEDAVAPVIETVEELAAPVTDAVAPLGGQADDAVSKVLEVDDGQGPSQVGEGALGADGPSDLRLSSWPDRSLAQGQAGRADGPSGHAARLGLAVPSPTERLVVSAGMPSLNFPERGASGTAAVIVRGVATSPVPGGGPGSGGASGDAGSPFMAVGHGRIAGPAVPSSVSVASDDAMVAIVPITFWGEPG